ncbi:MAG: hypothetical protein HYV67_01250 [Candidatus Taylorbacteria bacterium]|nr:hypothetical protein [Candidatus Taylorbacteria bacterium]
MNDNSSKGLLWLVVLIVVIVGGWYLWRGNTPQSAKVPAAPDTAAATEAVSDAVSSRDGSDDSLEQDMKSIDDGLADVDANSAAVDSGLNDQPVPQTE